MIDTRLSYKVSLGFQGGPEWSTLITELASGRERRNAAWAMPRHKYTADYSLIDDEGRFELLNAYMAARGRLHTLRFKDWNDFEGTSELLGAAVAGSDPMQLVRVYTFGSSSYTRDIKLPVNGTVSVTQNGVAKAVTVNYTTGEVTPTTAWTGGAEIRATFEFDVPVRFGSDFYPFTRLASNFTSCTVDLVEDLS